MALVGTFINIAIWSSWFFRVLKAFFYRNAYSKMLVVSAFLLPFYSASFGVLGFQVSMYKILPLFLLANYIILEKKINIKIFIISLYFLVVTLVNYYIAVQSGLFEVAIKLGRSEFSAFVGPVVQGGLFLLVLLQMWLIRKDAEIDHIKILSAYVLACIVLVGIGYLQLLCYVTGLPWFDFWCLNDAMGRSVDGGLNDYAMSGGIHRMSSLAGEPRHFAAVLVLALMIHEYLKSVGQAVPHISSRQPMVTSLILFSGIFFSASSSGILALLVGIGIYFFLVSKVKVFFLTLFFSCVFVYLGETTIIGQIIWKLTSIDMMLYAVPKDAFGLRAIVFSWEHFIFGYGTNLAEYFVPDLYFLQQTPFGLKNRYLDENPMEASIVPTSAMLQILLNGGVVGFLLLTRLFFVAIRHCKRKTKYLIFSILGMTSVSSTLVFTMAVFFFGIIANYETTKNNV